ncbi:hypothetical protein HYU92_01005 [Candidatus Curtissbacteria bacterium]|nr:hypothetical protein [Candidatus Curtissbacteria bacterium]
MQQRINITLPSNLARDLRKTIPSRSRSKFIAKALEEKLHRKKNLKKDLIRSLKANREFDKKEAETWKATELDGWPEY